MIAVYASTLAAVLGMLAYRIAGALSRGPKHPANSRPAAEAA
jgi:hypothetical protein